MLSNKKYDVIARYYLPKDMPILGITLKNMPTLIIISKYQFYWLAQNGLVFLCLNSPEKWLRLIL